ncbi:hypothetical protein MON38_04400 [Hymenobacter sp. DH14]|uniref:Uncharacterized protein n=1 Tax=Hymenobacter cyanobacteriorum TaxID=2926463 RepID=A0A9X1VEG2_9BACT|nr:hypothetical protein [Hymenobacter cyanobacteriorum]MCI1186647.1 hypothetical protein [Hymenobacter cyanobacteriorum]
MASTFARSFCALVVVAAGLSAHPVAAQMRDAETPTPRTWPVVLAQPLTDSGAALLQEVSAAVELLPEQITATRRVQTDAAEATAPAIARREIAVALTAAQLGRLRQWQAAHPQQAAQLGLPAQF